MEDVIQINEQSIMLQGRARLGTARSGVAWYCKAKHGMARHGFMFNKVMN